MPTILTDMPRQKPAGPKPLPVYLSSTDVADVVGLAIATVQAYYSRSKRVDRWWPEPGGDIPRPDVVVGRSPGWKRETIDAWIEERSAR
mgnify:CR=1 FL=1